ncbi:hypothetical protein TNCV_650451 [Trichonephila clavipes]|nr:hypothetical protein TNCV_650451 [Trichonephila clavipes]
MYNLLAIVNPRVEKYIVLFKIQTSQDVDRGDQLGITPAALRKYFRTLTKSESFCRATHKAEKALWYFLGISLNEPPGHLRSTKDDKKFFQVD